MFLIRLVDSWAATEEFLRQTNAYKVYLQVCFLTRVTQHKVFFHEMPTLEFPWIPEEEQDTAPGKELPRWWAPQSYLIKLRILLLPAAILYILLAVQGNPAINSFPFSSIPVAQLHSSVAAGTLRVADRGMPHIRVYSLTVQTNRNPRHIYGSIKYVK